MISRKFALTAAALAVLAMAMSPAQARRHHHHHWHGHAYGLPYPLSFDHNYGPGAQPGTFVYYDGPTTNRCYQSAARYVGQDNRGHPCF